MNITTNKYSYRTPMKRYLEGVQQAKLFLAITMRHNVMEPIFVSVIINYATMFAMISLPLKQTQRMIRQKEQILQMQTISNATNVPLKIHGV